MANVPNIAVFACDSSRHHFALQPVALQQHHVCWLPPQYQLGATEVVAKCIVPALEQDGRVAHMQNLAGVQPSKSWMGTLAMLTDIVIRMGVTYATFTIDAATQKVDSSALMLVPLYAIGDQV
jgi:hypothetical protein